MIVARTWLAVAAIVSAVACQRDRGVPTTPLTPDASREAFARCLFDDPPRRGDGSALEAALRRTLRADRMAFAVRAGRCESALDGVRDRDPHTGEFARAWDDLLPRFQNASPDDITLEQSIRHAGNAWRAW